MNQKLSDWAIVAELTSSIAVVVTLLFLILGVQENTDVVRVSSYDRNLQSVIDWRTSILEDPDAVRVFAWYFIEGNTDRSTLSSEDRGRLQLILGALWVSYEKAYFAQQYGLLGDAEWNRFVGNLCRNYGNDRANWSEAVSNFLSDEFSMYVINTCEEGVE